MEQTAAQMTQTLATLDQGREDWVAKRTELQSKQKAASCQLRAGLDDVSSSIEMLERDLQKVKDVFVEKMAVHNAVKEADAEEASKELRSAWTQLQSDTAELNTEADMSEAVGYLKSRQDTVQLGIKTQSELLDTHCQEQQLWADELELTIQPIESLDQRCRPYLIQKKQELVSTAFLPTQLWTLQLDQNALSSTYSRYTAH